MRNEGQFLSGMQKIMLNLFSKRLVHKIALYIIKNETTSTIYKSLTMSGHPASADKAEIHAYAEPLVNCS